MHQLRRHRNDLEMKMYRSPFFCPFTVILNVIEAVNLCRSIVNRPRRELQNLRRAFSPSDPDAPARSVFSRQPTPETAHKNSVGANRYLQRLSSLFPLSVSHPILCFNSLQPLVPKQGGVGVSTLRGPESASPRFFFPTQERYLSFVYCQCGLETKTRTPA